MAIFDCQKNRRVLIWKRKGKPAKIIHEDTCLPFAAETYVMLDRKEKCYRNVNADKASIVTYR
jgi:hypothetical protein